MTVQLSAELVEFVESGVSMLIGTRDADLRPESGRAVGARVSEDRRRVTVYVPAELAARTLANIADNGRFAVAFSRVVDHRTVQVKGRVLATRRAAPEERVVPERYLAAFVEQLYCAGMPRALGNRLRHWPAVAIEVEVQELFHQTPGPGAGRRMLPAP